MKKNEEEKRITKLKFPCLLFSASEWGSRTIGILKQYTNKGFLSVLAHLAVVITELLPYLKYRWPKK